MREEMAGNSNFCNRSSVSTISVSDGKIKNLNQSFNIDKTTSIIGNMFAKSRIGIFQKFLGRTHFNHFAICHDKNSLAIHDRLNTVGNGQDCAIVQRCPEYFLDKPIGVEVHICGGFVDANNL
jgi:hypothetical protein